MQRSVDGLYDRLSAHTMLTATRGNSHCQGHQKGSTTRRRIENAMVPGPNTRFRQGVDGVVGKIWWREIGRELPSACRGNQQSVKACYPVMLFVVWQPQEKCSDLSVDYALLNYCFAHLQRRHSRE